MTAITDNNDFRLHRPFLSVSEIRRCLSLEDLPTINLILDMAFRQTKSIKSYQSFGEVTGSSVNEQFELRKNTIHRIRDSR